MQFQYHRFLCTLYFTTDRKMLAHVYTVMPLPVNIYRTFVAGISIDSSYFSNSSAHIFLLLIPSPPDLRFPKMSTCALMIQVSLCNSNVSVLSMTGVGCQVFMQGNIFASPKISVRACVHVCLG